MCQVYFLCIFLIITFISGYEFIESTNLTTATIRQSTSPKTTIIQRRINVERDEMSTSSVIFRLSESRRNRRRKRTKLAEWSWDSWCQLQPREGKCDKHLIRYYYILQLDRCAPFSYSGCKGNENNFENLIECEKFCKGSGLLNIVESNSQPDYCNLQPNPGLCLAMMQKYYYDINELSCKKFTYGGCGGNSNKFDTMFSCMSTCSPGRNNT